MATRYIYKLMDPTNNKPFYVGQTFHLEQRFFRHIAESSLIETPNALYIKDIIKRGRMPYISQIEEIEYDPNDYTSLSFISERERFWIEALGIENLLKNMTHNPDPNQLRECPNCKDFFLVKKKFAKFCSAKCRVYWHRKNDQVPPMVKLKQNEDIAEVPTPKTTSRIHLGVPIPANLAGIDLTIWKQQIQDAMNRNP